MNRGTSRKLGDVATLERPGVLELADGTRLVPQPEARPSRVEADPNHAFTLADVQRSGGEPFKGYRLMTD